jgi:folate-binding Fe-S cluster repair protein YgfZ
MTAPLVVSSDQAVHWSLLEARGEDARSFLQGQLSCDVLSLTRDAWAAGLLLSPASEVITSLHCHHHLEGVDLVLASEMLEPTLSALRRFTLRTRCELRDAGATAGPYATVGEQVRRGEPGPREFHVGVAAHSFGPAFVARHVSFTKGCYTGQELVGRLDARGGRVPFLLARVRGPSVEHMSDVVARAGPTGERAIQGLTTVVADDGWVALGFVHRSLLCPQRHRVLDDVSVEALLA